MSYDWIGAASGLLLFATLIAQCHKQWREQTAEGVSMLFFVGQTLTSVGFIIYSALLGNWVFIITNVLILLSAAAGQIILWANRRREAPTRPR